MAQSAGSLLQAAPKRQLIGFERAQLRRVPFQDVLYLWVCGTLPAAGLEARLAPRQHHGRPEYWEIEVEAIAAHGRESEFRAGTGFERSVPLAGITGTRGILVIGANQSQRIEIDDGSFQGRNPSSRGGDRQDGP